jgi:ankyrin repeat protein
MLSGGRTSSANTGEKLKAAEPVAEAASPEPPTAKAPAISIHDAAEKGDIEAVKQYLAAGTDVKAMDKRGRTPLHFAAKRGQKELVELLIANGADVNAEDKVSATPLDFSIFRNHSETADLLRKHGGKTGEELKAGCEYPVD